MARDDPSASRKLAFTPVPVRYRHDGWTPERQIAFIEALAETGCIEAAARQVGMSSRSANTLRWRPRGKSFRDAWDAALDCTMHRVEQAAVERSIKGVARPIFYKGEQVGEYREHDEKLTMFLLRYRRRHRYGAWLDHAPLPGDCALPEPTDPAALELDGHLDRIADQPDVWPADEDGEPDELREIEDSPRE